MCCKCIGDSGASGDSPLYGAMSEIQPLFRCQDERSYDDVYAARQQTYRWQHHGRLTKQHHTDHTASPEDTIIRDGVCFKKAPLHNCRSSVGSLSIIPELATRLHVNETYVGMQT
ncbi:uncharacterized protein LOC124288032 [Haliotis rubra]|uniref:uncharacterized protein LOC124288032 n=1 Tax=Haliotis rubra TaxID=36100 RepID=UPI001EE544A8|nr:uncharacterized protein LOC124288032 [Haliotis rubra]